MPRVHRHAFGGQVYHVLNRATRRAEIFDTSNDYRDFELLLEETRVQIPVRILAHCLMPNHWHLVLWPTEDGQLSTFMHRLTTTHAIRWHRQRRTTGTGPVYQGRFKAVPVEHDASLIRVCRYVERNPRRAGLVERAEQWRWSSLWHRCRKRAPFRLDAWPVSPPAEWLSLVNAPDEPQELAELTTCLAQGIPVGGAAWQEAMARRRGLAWPLRGKGRPASVGSRAEATTGRQMEAGRSAVAAPQGP